MFDVIIAIVLNVIIIKNIFATSHYQKGKTLVTVLASKRGDNIHVLVQRWWWSAYTWEFSVAYVSIHGDYVMRGGCKWQTTFLNKNATIELIHMESTITVLKLMPWNPNPGPCITNVFATCRKNFSQWHSGFQRKLLSHWLKFLRHVAITLVIQGPVHARIHPCRIFNDSLVNRRWG